MKKVLAATFLFTYILSYCQVTVPFRVGNKFGISDESGKMIIPAEYDIIDIMIYGSNGEYVAVRKTSENEAKTTYIVNNKIVLKDTDYHYFSKDKGFITALKLKNPDKIYPRDSYVNNLTDIYTLDGKKVFPSSFRFVNFLENEKKPALKDEILILTNDLNGLYSLIVLNKKTLKISKTFFEGVRKVDSDYKNFPNALSLKYYKDSVGKMLTINFSDGKITSETVADIPSSSNYTSNSYYSTYSEAAGDYHDETKAPPINSSENIITEIKEITESRSRKPFEIPHLKIRNLELSPEYSTIVKEKGKLGYFNNNTKEWILPPKYDEIISTESSCAMCGTYIVRTGNIYNIWEIGNNKKEILKGNFEMLPIFKKRNYGREGFHLIQLFDKDGKLFSYANQDGSVYYKQ
ncbi:WG repeat-containing protein [Chryseobacterium luteum]|uniref:WG repeat-containing protein n=1 Tax=Chryseobacterium luteum TaxID=421531 RepID=A0A085YY80_9FLAO|nr:WG repeat-containing protein [Chryseobacterium luteum]KFE97143.1 hypothetical protein IX38_21365 [Chryseobacterium luteum]